jgi:hypothetical protein
LISRPFVLKLLSISTVGVFLFLSFSPTISLAIRKFDTAGESVPRAISNWQTDEPRRPAASILSRPAFHICPRWFIEDASFGCSEPKLLQYRHSIS